MFLTLTLSHSLSWRQSSLPKSHRAPHEAYEARALMHTCNACGFPHALSRRAGLHILNPESAGPSERPRDREKKSYAHAVSSKPLMKPGGIIQQACSGAPSRVCEHHHHRGSSRRTPNRLHRFLFFYYTTLSTQLSGTTRGTQLRSPLSLQRSISTPELILLCEIATLSKAESTTRGVSSAQPKPSGLSTRTQLISAAALEGPSCNTT